MVYWSEFWSWYLWFLTFMLGVALGFGSREIITNLKNLKKWFNHIYRKMKLKSHNICFQCEGFFKPNELIEYEKMKLCPKCYKLYTE